jgi:hypothetical protein
MKMMMMMSVVVVVVVQKQDVVLLRSCDSGDVTEFTIFNSVVIPFTWHRSCQQPPSAPSSPHPVTSQRAYTRFTS